MPTPRSLFPFDWITRLGAAAAPPFQLLRTPGRSLKWAKFIGSEEGQKIIAEYGIVFPASKAVPNRPSKS